MKPTGTRCLLAALLVCLCVADATAGTLKSRRFEGGEYVPVSDVAHYYRLGRNSSSDRDSAAYRDLRVEADRREIILDGVQHWLSAPVFSAQGKLWVSALDVLKTLDPVLRRGRTSKRISVRTIVLDPGHGGHDRGALGCAGGVEKTLVLDLARRLQQQLEPRGFTVWLTRTTDRFVPLEARTEFAAQKKADMLISIHLNANGTAHGVETFCLTPANAVSTATAFRGWHRSGQSAPPERGNRHDEQNIWLAHCIQKSLLRSTGAADRGVRRARFAVLRDAPCPAVLLEAGFLTHAAEERRLLTPDYRQRLAKAVAEGILSYKDAVEKN
ncbi:MAG: N-acetylmuramoyl-L-alanine amidase [Verrucomicrobiae bacterium]|nr:N-acetylmuramoyl-L-alanine amidase [Verrucomicrobiae bacterium]